MSERRSIGTRALSLNRTAAPALRRLIDDAAGLRIDVETPPEGYRLVDAGIGCTGGLEAGRLITEICMAGLGRVSLRPATHSSIGPGC